MSDLKSSGLEIEFTARQSVNDVIASLGRTEDVCFSPSNRRVAVAAFIRHRVAFFDIENRDVCGRTARNVDGRRGTVFTGLE